MKMLNRSRLNYKLRRIHQFPITIASAPSGFGKTAGLRAYFNHHLAHTCWFSMYEQEDEDWAWMRVMRSISELLGLPKQNMPIPTSRRMMDTYLQTIIPLLKAPLFIVFDDVNVQKFCKHFKFLSMYSYLPHPDLHFIIITKDAPDSLISHDFSNQTMMLRTDDFAFSEKETSQLCRLANPSLSQDDIAFLYTYTKGWILALCLMLESYRLNGNFHDQGDINTLIQQVLYNHLTEEVQLNLMKLSLLKSFTLPFAYDICRHQETMQLLTQLEKEKQFIQKIDSDNYQFVPLFKEFLTTHLLTSGIDIKELCDTIGSCYLLHKHPLHAIEIFLKSRDYDSIMRILQTYQEVSFSDVAPQLMMDVFKQLPNTYKNNYPHVYLKWIADCITNFPKMQGPYLLEDFKQRIDHALIEDDKQQLYGEYYFIHAFLSFNNVFAMIDAFKKAHDYFQGNTSKFAYPFMITSFGSCHMLFLYYNQLSKLEETKDYIINNLHYFIHISNGLHTGTINLIKAEYLYETGMYEDVPALAHIAYQEAMDKNQLSGAICCLFLLGRYAYMQKDPVNFSSALQQLQDFYTMSDSPIIHNEIDCALSYLYILNNDCENVKDWLKDGSFQDAYLLPEGSMMAYIIHGLYLLKVQNKNALRAHMLVIGENNKSYSFAFANIFCQIFEIAITCESGNLQNVWEQFNSLLQMCCNDSIYSILIECSFVLDPFITTLQPSSPYEETLLSLIDVHISKGNMNNSCILSPKEDEILILYAQGNRVKDIATLKSISINTVQFHLKSIYRKLKITSKSELVTYYFKNY